MVRIYLDIETYRPKEEGAFTDEKIVLVGLILDETPYKENSLRERAEPILFSEWPEGSEKQILMSTFKFIEQMAQTHKFTVIVGFNILRYDIPLMIVKATDHGIQKVDDISKFWYNVFTADYFQELLPANQNLFKGLRLDRIVEKAKELGVEPPEIFGTGADVKEWYEKKMYDKIEKHITQDLQIARWLDLFGAKRLIAESLRLQAPLFRE